MNEVWCICVLNEESTLCCSSDHNDPSAEDKMCVRVCVCVCVWLNVCLSLPYLDCFHSLRKGTVLKCFGISSAMFISCCGFQGCFNNSSNDLTMILNIPLEKHSLEVNQSCVWLLIVVLVWVESIQGCKSHRHPRCDHCLSFFQRFLDFLSD